MKLKPVPVDEVLEFATLPYPLYTQDGLLLLSAHASLKDPFVRRRLTELTTVHVPCDANEPAAKDTQEPPPRPANGVYAHPDQLAAVLIKAVGFYPPGTYVGLSTQECGIVLARGRRANAPLVAALTSAEGTVMAEPLLRDTGECDTAVVAALPYGVLHLEPPLLALQALRMRLRAAEELPPKPAPAELSAQAA